MSERDTEIFREKGAEKQTGGGGGGGAVSQPGTEVICKVRRCSQCPPIPMTDYPPTLQVTFSMDDGTDYFTIEGDNTLAALATFNYEKVASVAVTIRATDNQGLHTVKRLLIQVCVPASVCVWGGGGGEEGGGKGEGGREREVVIARGENFQTVTLLVPALLFGPSSWSGLPLPVRNESSLNLLESNLMTFPFAKQQAHHGFHSALLSSSAANPCLLSV